MFYRTLDRVPVWFLPTFWADVLGPKMLLGLILDILKWFAKLCALRCSKEKVRVFCKVSFTKKAIFRHKFASYLKAAA
jgi:hypothetical protein